MKLNSLKTQIGFVCLYAFQKGESTERTEEILIHIFNVISKEKDTVDYARLLYTR